MDTALIDRFGRRIDYLRLSVIEQCNFHCFYCKPNRQSACSTREQLLSTGQIARVVRVFASLGVSRFRLTGGEPLVRKEIVAIAEAIDAVPGVNDLSLSTNGYLLERHASALHQAGVQRINVSLDSLDRKGFGQITQGADIQPVMRGIDQALDVGIEPIKLNMVVMRGVNDDQIVDMIEYASGRGLHLRFIETMPLGAGGSEAMRYHLPSAEILARVKQHYGTDLVPVAGCRGAGPARYYRVGDRSTTLGVISAVSRHFCAECNRVRLSARGELQLCLSAGRAIPLKPYLDQPDDEPLRGAILRAIDNKPYSHHFEDDSGTHQQVDMHQVGG